MRLPFEVKFTMRLCLDVRDFESSFEGCMALFDFKILEILFSYVL